MGALRLSLAAFGLADATGAADLPYANAVADAVAARFAEPAVRYDMPGLRSGGDNFTRNDELLAALHTLAAAPRGPRRVLAGRSQAGLAIEALQFSSAPGRPAVLRVGQQHGDSNHVLAELAAAARVAAVPAPEALP